MSQSLFRLGEIGETTQGAQMLAHVLQTARRFLGLTSLEILIPGSRALSVFAQLGHPSTHGAGLGTSGQVQKRLPCPGHPRAMIWAWGLPVSKFQAVPGPPSAQRPSPESQTHEATQPLLPRPPWELGLRHTLVITFPGT